MSMLWRKTFLFTELNAFAASTRRTASICSFLYILNLAWTAASNPDFCPAHTWNGLTDMMMSSRRVDTITFPNIRLSTSPTPTCRSLGFLSNGIRRQERKAFSMHSFFIMLAIVVHKSVDFSKNCIDVESFSNHLHLSPKVQNHL